MKNVLILANPNAGVEALFMLAKISLLNRLKKEAVFYQIYETIEQVPGKILKSPLDKVIVLGGDGTLHFVTQYLYNKKIDIPIAVIPTGSGNIFALTVGIPITINKAIKTALHGKPKRIPLGIVNDKHLFMISVTTGVHAQIMEKTPRWSKKIIGAAAYYLRLPLDLANIIQHEYQITLDNKKTIQGKASSVFVFNGMPKISRGTFSNMNLFSSKLYVLIVDAIGAKEIAQLFTSIFIQGKLAPKGSQFYETKSLSLITKNSSTRLDSEQSTLKNMTIKTIPGVVRFMLPK
ncbi:MAG: diacylglycerol kinase family protein [Patescibacteria group bacterium]|jgi:diacylglycerol kinase family enzyme